MERTPKICLIGAGGMSFGPTMVHDVIKTPALRGALLMLHDVDPVRLDQAFRLATRLNAGSGSPIRLDRSTDPGRAMDGADFCLASAEFKRWQRWREDYEIPVKHGATHITGENGGPGAVFHSLRSIANTLSICEDLVRHCPDTFLINLTNPMSRVTLAINTATSIANVGMCHEFDGGVTRLAGLLRIPKADIRAEASGINHFTFFTEITRVSTGEDLYPRIRDLWAKRFFDFPPPVTSLAKALLKVPVLDISVEQLYAPLVAHMVREYGVLPCSVDSHIGEYVPDVAAITGWHPTPVDFHEQFQRRFERMVRRYADGHLFPPLHRLGHSPEEPIPIIASMWTGERRRINAVNVPNRGYVPNLPDGAIVEVPAECDGDGLHPVTMAPIVEPLADMMRTQIELQDLVVKSALTGDPEPAFEAVLRDPLSPKDERACKALFDELRTLQADQLPF